MTLVIDIETVPLEAAMLEPYPAADRQPPSNYKLAEAIAQWRVKDVIAWENARAKECSLTPRLGRVLCIGIREVGGKDALHMAVTEADERTILTAFWDTLLDGEHRVHDLVTWNGSWDLRFLLLRSLVRGVTPTIGGSRIRDWFRKYSFTHGHFDCKAALTNWEPRSTEGLGEWARALNVTTKTEGLDGSDVYPLFLAGQVDDIGAYCLQDVAATAAVYEKVSPYFL